VDRGRCGGEVCGSSRHAFHPSTAHLGRLWLWSNVPLP
jgi:hypothetical protein